MASDSYHEPVELLSVATRDMHRAITSLMEELEAIDWYQQRVDASPDPELKSVLEHNKNEEIEHAMMVLEWIRRHSEHFDAAMRTYLFTKAPIVDLEKSAEAGGGTAPADGSLGIGRMKGR